MAAIVPLTEPVQALLQLLIAKHSMTDDEVRQQSTSATSDVFGIAHGALPASRQTPPPKSREGGAFCTAAIRRRRPHLRPRSICIALQ